ncbi:uroplakin-3b-like [Pleurodeles waltl]|uniref:uroplakin-3b-like n=1 Tax=Pleurodeles waltl TaxID=8319 RepID=UPI0037093E79
MSPGCAVLLLALLETGNAAVTQIDFKPQITTKNMEGKITGTTFALGTPVCIFREPDVSPEDMVWLVVATSKGYMNFHSSAFVVKARPAYQDFPTPSYYYLTLNVQAGRYPCDVNMDLIKVIRVGGNTSCARDRRQPDCNGPVPPPGPYRVKFLVTNSSNDVKAETLWSDNIRLITGKNPSAIDINPVRRSSGMIVITTILSILIAILLALTASVLMFGWKELSRRPTLVHTGFYSLERFKPPLRSPFGSLRISSYITHHIPEVRAAEGREVE